jgi:hypothetical protein
MSARRWTRRRGEGPFLLEIDMLSIGSFKTTFAGPPVNKLAPIATTVRGSGLRGHVHAACVDGGLRALAVACWNC